MATSICSLAVSTLLACGPGAAGDDQVGDDDVGDDVDDGAGDANPATGCKRVDVVIAVDDSGSMTEEKSALREIAFPGFANALKNVAGGLDDFRVGVVDACIETSSFHTGGASGPCNFSSGTAWIESTSPVLVDEFKCVGDILPAVQCTTRFNEQPVAAAIAALQLASPAASPPNGGFLRDDALLVVVAITDEDEHSNPDATPLELYDRLIAIKGDDVKKMVFLGIGGAANCMGVYGTAYDARKLRAVTELFSADQRGVFWDLCQGNLEQGLAQALTTIESACEDFGPIL